MISNNIATPDFLSKLIMLEVLCEECCGAKMHRLKCSSCERSLPSAYQRSGIRTFLELKLPRSVIDASLQGALTARI
ncbi:MAG: hypothetical protein JO233_04220 [Candidatus Eremiobacteraeota bacterium]|nr:hypothetical protein [Candidatus Eremiobacteraeota bacterium]